MRIVRFGVVVAVLLAAGFLATAAVGEKGAPAGGGPTDRVLFAVEGLSCGSCEGRVVEALRALPGVRAVGVDLAAGRVGVEYEPGRADPKRLADAVTRLGYPARYLASGPSVALGAAGRPGSSGCGGTCCGGGQ
ncbi:heavy-metal-associated domain-containing protein [Deferrisoma palaeochoriense]